MRDSIELCRDKPKEPLFFDFYSVKKGQVFQDCLRLFGTPSIIIFKLSLWLKTQLWLVATKSRIPVRTPLPPSSSACSITPPTTPITTMADQDESIHGLVYPSTFLPTLQVLLPRPPPHQPIRALSAQQFAQIHLQSLLSHAPDSALFPFLHGLEGDNEAQIQFFSSYGRVSRRSMLPNYRGLVWVACDDDQPEVSQSTHSSPVYSDDDELDDDDFSSSEIEGDDDSPQPFEMDIDRPPSDKLEIDTNNLPHMHPVHHRTMSTTSDSQLPVYAVDYAYSNVRRPSNASSFTASSLNTPDSATTFSTSTSFSTDPVMSQLPQDDPRTVTADGNAPMPGPLSPSPPPPMPWTLTSSFRPSELLVNTPHGPEFVRPRVPDGISLRNFGIQVVSRISDHHPETTSRPCSPVLSADPFFRNFSPSMPQFQTSSSTLQRALLDLLSPLLKSLSELSKQSWLRGRSALVRTAIQIRNPT
jgi:hypothetical protein